MLDAKRMRRVILSDVALLAVPYPSTLTHTTKFLEKKKSTEYGVRVLFFFLQLLSDTFYHSKKN